MTNLWYGINNKYYVIIILNWLALTWSNKIYSVLNMLTFNTKRTHNEN